MHERLFTDAALFSWGSTSGVLEWLIPAHESQLFSFQKFCRPAVKSLIAWNQPCWEYIMEISKPYKSGLFFSEHTSGRKVGSFIFYSESTIREEGEVTWRILHFLTSIESARVRSIQYWYTMLEETLEEFKSRNEKWLAQDHWLAWSCRKSEEALSFLTLTYYFLEMNVASDSSGWYIFLPLSSHIKECSCW